MNTFPHLVPAVEQLKIIDPSQDLEKISHSFMLYGLKSKKDELQSSHPLEASEKNYRANLEEQDFSMLRNIHGLHAPLRLQFERKIARNVQRLPCLTSSNLMLENLTGRLDIMDFMDVFNDPHSSHTCGNPHMLMEKRLGIL